MGGKTTILDEADYCFIRAHSLVSTSSGSQPTVAPPSSGEITKLNLLALSHLTFKVDFRVSTDT